MYGIFQKKCKDNNCNNCSNIYCLDCWLDVIAAYGKVN